MITHRFSGESRDPQVQVLSRSGRHSPPSTSGYLPISVQDVETWVKKHQLISLSVAVLLGASVGWIIKRKL